MELTMNTIAVAPMARKILLIDDEEDIRFAFGEFLKALGYDISLAEDGEIGVCRARESRPDLIVCDVLMPGMNGYEVLAQLRDDPETATTPFIFLTGNNERAFFRRGMEMGADDYLTKPCSGEELVNAVSARLNKQQTIEHRFQRQAQKWVCQDTVTGLLSLAGLKDEFERPANAGFMPALLVIGIDRYTRLLEFMGNSQEEELHREVAHRLQQVCEGRGTAARLSEFEYAILVSRFENEPQVQSLAREAVESLSQPLFSGGREIFLTASAGIAFRQEISVDLTRMIRFARRALQSVTKRGGNGFSVHSPHVSRCWPEELALESDLRHALKREELQVVYQPQVSSSSGRITGAEALSRWSHPRFGMIPPSRFIPVAEDTGLILSLGEWTLRQACLQAAQWNQNGRHPIRMAVNLSGRQFHQPDLLSRVRSVLSQTGLEPDMLELEIVESTIMEDEDFCLQRMKDLKELGVRLSIDDFGTGYSSLSYLRKFPFDLLKVDQSFVRNITTEPKNMAILSAVIRMAHQMKLSVIAEGVETKEEVDFLVYEGCDEFQGFYFSRPVPPEEFTRLLATAPFTV